jgi:nucleotide-binding universal stress UspA family protein
MTMFKSILIPVDLSVPETADKAMAIAKEMASAEGTKLTVVSVQLIAINASGHQPPDFRPEMEAYLAKHRGDGEIAGMLKIGTSVSAEIRYAAKEISADLIVMNSHNPHYTDYLIGSNAAHVALHTPCSVMVVR